MAYVSGYQELANAIVVQAARDFRAAYARLLRYPDQKVTKETVRDLEDFFQSRDFATLTSLNGPELLVALKKEVEEKYGQK